jgi:hypothetical protein
MAPNGEQMFPKNCVDMLFFFYRGVTKSVMPTVTNPNGAFYGESGFVNLILGSRPSTGEVIFAVSLNFLIFLSLFLE